jgi:hypothetical protein
MSLQVCGIRLDQGPLQMLNDFADILGARFDYTRQNLYFVHRFAIGSFPEQRDSSN